MLDIKPEHRVLEVGPGRGALTADILRATKDVIAVEIDRNLSRNLQGRFPQLKLVEADILKVDDSLFRSRRVVGNLPYNISTPLLLRLTSILDVVDVHFMLQKEVVERMIAKPGTKAWGRLSVKMQQIFDVQPVFEVSPEVFEPPPRVFSAFVRLKHKNSPLIAQNPILFDAILRQAFSHRRKTLANSLASFQIDWQLIGIDSMSRADQLTVEQFVKIADELNKQT